MDVSNLNDAIVENHLCKNCLSSLKIGAGVKAYLCENVNCDGWGDWWRVVEVVGPYNAGALVDGINDWVSHIKI